MNKNFLCQQKHEINNYWGLKIIKQTEIDLIGNKSMNSIFN